ncbi:MAG: extradiol ring-cleavage dioxygenase [Firmicutes bacterium]|nr:extradiol ring-cleavage dioxygenase [Bacillota bacterium]
MSGIVHGCIVPHGYEVIPPLAGPEHEGFAPISAGLAKVAERLKAARPDVIVLATPHGFRVAGQVTVATNSFAHGRLGKFGHFVDVECACDRTFASALIEAASAQDIPVKGAYFGSAQGDFSILPLDWGAVVPLWFFHEALDYKPDVVILTPTRDAGLEPLVRLGHVIADVATASDKRVAFVASADQGHAHDAEGPYGYHPASKAYDEAVCEAIKRQDLASLLALDPSFVDDAKPDSLWQIAILQGVLERSPMTGELYSYNVPTYYGMLCANYERS